MRRAVERAEPRGASLRVVRPVPRAAEDELQGRLLARAGRILDDSNASVGRWRAVLYELLGERAEQAEGPDGRPAEGGIAEPPRPGERVPLTPHPGREREAVWRLYMTGSALAFDRGEISVHQILAAAPGAPHGLPLVREPAALSASRG